MLIVINPHDIEHEVDYSRYKSVYSIFLAGTIDDGNSTDWQAKYIEQMKSIYDNLDDCCLIIYNPRRNNWDENDLDYQIQWELEHMEMASMIFMNLLPNSKSPISLMELGLFAHTNKLRVVCPKEFYRYHNVKAVCDKYLIPFKEKFEHNWSFQPKD